MDSCIFLYINGEEEFLKVENASVESEISNLLNKRYVILGRAYVYPGCLHCSEYTNWHSTPNKVYEFDSSKELKEIPF